MSEPDPRIDAYAQGFYARTLRTVPFADMTDMNQFFLDHPDITVDQVKEAMKANVWWSKVKVELGKVGGTEKPRGDGAYWASWYYANPGPQEQRLQATMRKLGLALPGEVER